MIPALASLLMFQLIGELIVQWTGLPLPGPLVGMMLLFAGLVLLGRVPFALESATGLLFRDMMLLFIPIIAGVIMHVDHVRAEWLPFVAACIVGTAITLIVTAVTLQFMLGRKGSSAESTDPAK